MRFAVLVGSKGRGSNMAALISGSFSGAVQAEAALVVAPREDAPAVARARALGVPVAVVPIKGEGYAGRLLSALGSARVEIVCLAGYMSLLPGEVVAAFEGRILNIHPALLPKFGGKGMYGIHVHEAVIAAGESESGCTVHLVDERYDEGAILLQRRVPVLPDDTAETLAERVLDQEHIAYQDGLNLLVERLQG
ncbi:MAG: phosphoribosylglycinamide formyltransferase [Fimbriimonadaceae bacterium]|nr:phosphoribosylglycinamide formyltransferase [Fimbriimonadaceae bacterium]